MTEIYGVKVEMDGTVFGKRKVLKPIKIDGYYYVGVRIDGKWKHKAIHRLVAECYIPNPNNLPQVNHIDGDKSNNNSSNLEWSSAKHNMKHAYDTGLINNNGDNAKYAKLTKQQVIEIRELKGKLSQSKIGKLYGISQGHVSDIILNKKWK